MPAPFWIAAPPRPSRTGGALAFTGRAPGEAAPASPSANAAAMVSKTGSSHAAIANARREKKRAVRWGARAHPFGKSRDEGAGGRKNK